MCKQLGQEPFVALCSDVLSAAAMVIAFAYLSLVSGELVLEAIGLSQAE